MITEDVAVRAPQHTSNTPSAARSARAPASSPAEPTDIGLGWRLLLVLVGFLLASIGWVLVLTILLSFIGLPLFIFGLSLMQAQER